MPTVVDLGRLTKAKHPEYASMDDAEVGRRVKAKYPQYASFEDMPDSVGAPPMAMTQQSNPLMSAGDALKGMALKGLPAVGGFLGGVAGSPAGLPGMVYGAAAGGALGEGARQGLSGEKIDPMSIAHEGAGQGLLEAGGGALSWGAKALAKPVMRSALSRLPRGFPDPTETMLEEGIPVSRGGLSKANALREKSSQKLQGVLSKAEAAGTTFKKSDVTSGVTKLLGKRALKPNMRSGVEAELADFIAQHPDDITPTLLKEIKSEHQGEAGPAFAAMLRKGTDIGSAATRRYDRRLSAGAQKELEKIPGVGAIEGKTQALIGTGRAIETAINGPPRVIQHTISGLAGGAVGYGASHNPVGAAAGIAAGEALTSRHAVSRYALILNSPTFRALMRQSPRLAAEFLHQSTNPSAPADATSGK